MGFTALLESQDDMSVVGAAGDGQQAVRLAAQLKPDVVLMDIRMPVLGGIEATRLLTQAKSPPRVLVLTTFDLDDYVYDALRAGASGFLLKDATPEEILPASGSSAVVRPEARSGLTLRTESGRDPGSTAARGGLPSMIMTGARWRAGSPGRPP